MSIAKNQVSPEANLNETGRRSGEERRQEDQPVDSDRREVQRRRQIDPTTCERDYSNPEIEFMQALDHYKRQSGRMFPTCSEILEVLLGLGYRRVVDGVLIEDTPSAAVTKPADDGDSEGADDEGESRYDDE